MHLKPGGVFIFDVNTPKKLSRYANENSYAFIGTDIRTIVQVTEDSKNRYTFHVESFLPAAKGKFDRKRVKIPELILPVEQIRIELKKYFTSITAWDTERARVSPASEEVYFICRGSVSKRTAR